jgi:hypothetical protein
VLVLALNVFAAAKVVPALCRDPAEGRLGRVVVLEMRIAVDRI